VTRQLRYFSSTTGDVVWNGNRRPASVGARSFSAQVRELGYLASTRSKVLALIWPPTWNRRNGSIVHRRILAQSLLLVDADTVLMELLSVPRCQDDIHSLSVFLLSFSPLKIGHVKVWNGYG
jgi:hypothetical protein